MTDIGLMSDLVDVYVHYLTDRTPQGARIVNI
jgi:hypothetical protein